MSTAMVDVDLDYQDAERQSFEPSVPQTQQTALSEHANGQPPAWRMSQRAVSAWQLFREGLNETATPCQQPGAADGYSDDLSERRRAVKECGPCPLIDACLAYALANAERHGVWGGHLGTAQGIKLESPAAALAAATLATQEAPPEQPAAAAVALAADAGTTAVSTPAAGKSGTSADHRGSEDHGTTGRTSMPNLDHPTAAAAWRIRHDHASLRSMVADVRAATFGTTSRTGAVHIVPGGVSHLDLSREVRDVFWGYVEIVADVRSVRVEVRSNTVARNAEIVALHAAALDGVYPLLCSGHHEPTAHDTVTEHLECLAHRLRLRVDPPGEREFVGPCPATDEATGQACGRDLRAYEDGPARCSAGHEHDTAAVRDRALAGVGDQLLTLRQVVNVAPRLTDRSITLSSIRRMVNRGRLSVAERDETGAALVRWADVRATYGLV